MGAEEGTPVGSALGIFDGSEDGVDEVGAFEGSPVGIALGKVEGTLDGDSVGVDEVGWTERYVCVVGSRDTVGSIEGTGEGCGKGTAVGCVVGSLEGEELGRLEEG